MKKNHAKKCRRAMDCAACASLLAVSCWSMVGCNNTPGPKFSSTELVQRLSGMQELSSKCQAADNAEAADCKLVHEQLAKLGTGNKVYYRSGQGSLIGVDFSAHVIVVLESVGNGTSAQWKCSVSPSEAAPAACDVLR